MCNHVRFVLPPTENLSESEAVSLTPGLCELDHLDAQVRARNAFRYCSGEDYVDNLLARRLNLLLGKGIPN